MPTTVAPSTLAPIWLPTEHGYTLAFVFAATACGLATIASLAAPRHAADKLVAEPA